MNSNNLLDPRHEPAILVRIRLCELLTARVEVPVRPLRPDSLVSRLRIDLRWRWNEVESMPWVLMHPPERAVEAGEPAQHALRGLQPQAPPRRVWERDSEVLKDETLRVA